MYVAEIWRYPVKSLAGEQLESAFVGQDGIDGDRRVFVEQRGRTITARTHPGLLALRGSLSADGMPRVDDEPWTSGEAVRRVSAAAGSAVELVAAPTGAFDVLPLLVATDGAADFLEIDRRRLRPNVVIGGAPGLTERLWPGSRLVVGEAVFYLARLRPRCVMTTYDPDTQAQDHSVLRRIVHELDGAVALDTAVERPGRIRVGDPVRLASLDGNLRAEGVVRDVFLKANRTGPILNTSSAQPQARTFKDAPSTGAGDTSTLPGRGRPPRGW